MEGKTGVKPGAQREMGRCWVGKQGYIALSWMHPFIHSFNNFESTQYVLDTELSSGDTAVGESLSFCGVYNILRRYTTKKTMKKCDEYYDRKILGQGMGPLRGVQPKGNGFTKEVSVKAEN